MKEEELLVGELLRRVAVIALEAGLWDGAYGIAGLLGIGAFSRGGLARG